MEIMGNNYRKGGKLRAGMLMIVKRERGETGRGLGGEAAGGRRQALPDVAARPSASCEAGGRCRRRQRQIGTILSRCRWCDRREGGVGHSRPSVDGEEEERGDGRVEEEGDVRGGEQTV